jgi:hypothetical protein
MVSPKTKFLEWDPTASNNTDIAGISILGTAAVDNFDDALRTVMAQLRSGVDGEVVYAAKSSGYTAVANDNNAILRFTASATLSLTAAATLATNWHITVMAQGGDVTIDPNASETINGATTLLVRDGQAAFIVCNGTAFFATVVSTAIFGIKGADIASAATTDLSTATGDYVNITGTTTITSFGTAPAGTRRALKFANNLTLTNNANIVLRNGATMETFPGAIMEFVSEGGGVWRQVCNTPSRNSWTPTVSSSSGTITTASASGYYYKTSNIITIVVVINITTNGTGAQSVVISLPIANNASFGGIVTGRETNIGGKTVTGYVAAGSSSMAITNYDNTYPGSSGAVIRLTGQYVAD